MERDNGLDITMVTLMSDLATMPDKATEQAAGFDLYSARKIKIEAGQRDIVDTDIIIQLPKGTYGKIESRSSVALKGIDVMAGCIDSDFRGKIKILLANNSKNQFTIDIGDKVAQLVVLPLAGRKIIKTEVIDDTERGEKGFGSSGKRVKLSGVDKKGKKSDNLCPRKKTKLEHDTPGASKH